MAREEIQTTKAEARVGDSLYKNGMGQIARIEFNDQGDVRWHYVDDGSSVPHTNWLDPKRAATLWRGPTVLTIEDYSEGKRLFDAATTGMSWHDLTSRSRTTWATRACWLRTQTPDRQFQVTLEDGTILKVTGKNILKALQDAPTGQFRVLSIVEVEP